MDGDTFGEGGRAGGKGEEVEEGEGSKVLD